MYHVDSRRRGLHRYRYDLDTGTATDAWVLVEFDDATPDGLCVDAEGCLWVALWDGWRVCRYAPDGRWLAQVDLPVPRPTAVCLLDGALLITTARVGLTDAALRAAPDSGRIFAAEVHVAAAPTQAWNGR
jgi:sugar lactone lactonase YvrE